ncbi:MAG: FtsW/RodA/SpoVE family cell cycle protein [Tannerellaceae bacterium]|jgi:cell division protein FtsW|nr:FtsW/RodA/SpoVE family cell cycle protein [Tannerellaceae bacterium]
MDLFNRLFKGDRVIWVIFMALCIVSVIEVFSAISTLAYKSGDYLGPGIRHASFLLGGFLLILIIHNLPCRFFSILIVLMPVSALILLYTLFFGEEINDSSRWINLFGIRFQPSEIAKLSCIVYVSFLLSRRKMYTDAQIFKYILCGVTVICALILPENFSTAAILFLVCFLMMFIGGISLKRIGLLSVILLLLAVSFFSLLHSLPDPMIKKYDILAKIKHRTENTFTPTPPLDAKTYDLNDYNRQESYAKIAIANGGLGKLPGHGQQRDTLPQAYADFIYAIIIEEMGIIAGFFVLLLYIILIIRVGAIAHKCDKLFPKFLVLGCGLMIGVQALANMAVVVGLFPVTGQPLPLVSRGGTSTVITCVYFGIILSVSRFGAGMGNEDDEEDEDEEPQEIEGEKIEEEHRIEDKK